MSKPTFVLVPGAWHKPETWGPISAKLEAQEYKCVAMTLPSTLGDRNTSLADDVSATRELILAETTQGRNVVVVAHSYGGLLGSSAIKGLSIKDKQDETHGHVVGIVLIGTGFVITGMGFLEGFDGKPPPIWNMNEETGFTDLIVDARELFYHDLPQEEGELWVSKLQNQAWKPFIGEGEQVYSGWKDVPVWYLITSEDKAFPPPAQFAMAEMAKSQGADLTVRELDSSHSPMLSRVEETAQILLDAVKAFTA
ncbi:Alpha/beta hydrolase nvfD-like protein [Cladobotryum mycophilum]|uniref:Alpha/beta hydrolase nvfD-like protein n=1 Tax=Cladobotryum mycophilum TaxID=491253 RepID=A0ABR0SWG3_9HYPO